MRGLLVTSILTVSAAPASAQLLGSPLPAPTVVDLQQTEARCFEEYQGRLVLIEFFAHW